MLHSILSSSAKSFAICWFLKGLSLSSCESESIVSESSYIIWELSRFSLWSMALWYLSFSELSKLHWHWSHLNFPECMDFRWALSPLCQQNVESHMLHLILSSLNKSFSVSWFLDGLSISSFEAESTVGSYSVSLSNSSSWSRSLKSAELPLTEYQKCL